MRRYTFWINGAYKGYVEGVRTAVIYLHSFESRGYSRSDITVFDEDGHEVLLYVQW